MIQRRRHIGYIVYTLLEKTYDTCPGNDIKIIIGDINVQVGKKIMCVPTIGMHSYGKGV